jgi:hypothetical protein
MGDIIIRNIQTGLVTSKPEYNVMLQNIDAKLPAVVRDSSNFYKSHSQFMGVTIDVTALTPIRSVKHTLAEIDRTRAALQEAYINVQKKQIELRRKEHKLENDTEIDRFDRELLEVEILELRSQLKSTQDHMEGAVRKMNFFVNQHDALMKKIGKEMLTEEDFEREESRYHIMTCMKQALNAARSRNGMIDEGNLIYLFELGINAAQAQAEMFAYLNLENQLVSEGKAPTHEMTMAWLEACADKWLDCPRDFAERRGFQILDLSSLTNLIEHAPTTGQAQDTQE